MFQRQVVLEKGIFPVAWQLFVPGSYDQAKQIPFSGSLLIDVNDWRGNYSQRLPVVEGDSFKVMDDLCCGRLFLHNSQNCPNRRISVFNGLKKGAIDINLYRSGRLFGKWPGLIPGQSAFFRDNKTIFISTAFRLEPGMPVTNTHLTGMTKRLDLHGIAKADIVMTGGGFGRGALPFAFHMENIQKR